MSSTPPPSSRPPPSSKTLPPKTAARINRFVQAACVLSLVALALITWSLLEPKPIPVIAAMSVGQGLGTLSLILFIATMVMDLRARRVLGRRDSVPPGPPEPPR